MKKLEEYKSGQYRKSNINSASNYKYFMPTYINDSGYGKMLN